MPHPAPAETEIVDRVHVACDGGGAALGHPRVWLQIDASIGFVECGYCDKRFVLRGHDARARPGEPASGASGASVGEPFGDRTDGEGLDERA